MRVALLITHPALKLAARVPFWRPLICSASDQVRLRSKDSQPVKAIATTTFALDREAA